MYARNHRRLLEGDLVGTDDGDYIKLGNNTVEVSFPLFIGVSQADWTFVAPHRQRQYRNDGGCPYCLIIAAYSRPKLH